MSLTATLSARCVLSAWTRSHSSCLQLARNTSSIFVMNTPYPSHPVSISVSSSFSFPRRHLSISPQTLAAKQYVDAAATSRKTKTEDKEGSDLSGDEAVGSDQNVDANINSHNVATSEASAAATTSRGRLRLAVAEYGATIFVFHISLALTSLGICYVLVSAGVPIENILSYFGSENSVMTDVGTFAVAYAVHKVFAPARIAVTLAVAPWIVKRLRKIGLLKKR